MRLIHLALVLVTTALITGCERDYIHINDVPVREERVNAAWAEIEVQYQRRAELIPNLVEVVRKASAHERETLLLVTEARAAAQSSARPESAHDATNMQTYEAAQANLSKALSSFIVTIERYPELQTNRNYLTLMSQLEGTENRIALARSNYVHSVAAYNAALKTYPSKLWRDTLYSDRQPIETYYTSSIENADQAPAVEL